MQFLGGWTHRIQGILCASLGAFLTCAFFLSSPSQAAEDLAPYDFEISPTLAINLPDGLAGISGSLTVFGLRADVNIDGPSSVEVSALYQSATGDSAYTIDASYRYELKTDYIWTYFNVGAHYTKYTLSPLMNTDGTCVMSGCFTNSGAFGGFMAGGGIEYPLTPMLPLRLGMRFYTNPVLSLLLEAQLGFRF